MGKRLTHEEFLNKLPNEFLDKYEILSEYINQKIDIKLKHLICGYIWETKSYSLIKGHGCPKCAGVLKKSAAEFIVEIYELVKDDYTILGEYTKAKELVLFKHNKCSKTYSVSPDAFLRGSRCPFCAGLYGTKEDFEEELKKVKTGSYKLIGEYINKKTKVQLQHSCGNIWLVKPYDFLRGVRCPKCQHRSYKKTDIEFKEEILQLTEGDYSVLEGYINVKTKILFKHNTCGHEWLIKPNNFLNGKRCPKCASSKGEKLIRGFLDNSKVLFSEEFLIKYSINKYPLRLDFNLNSFSMEYDGSQHFSSFEYFGGETNLEETIRKDKIKNQYCIDNSIPLLRIPYWEQSNIEPILSSALMHFNIIAKDESYNFSLIEEWLVDENWDHDAYIAKCPKNIKEANKLLTSVN